MIYSQTCTRERFVDPSRIIYTIKECNHKQWKTPVTEVHRIEELI